MSHTSAPVTRKTPEAMNHDRQQQTRPDNTDRPLLKIEDLSVRIPSPRGVVQAVSNIDLSLERGRTLGLVGESGSGKSMTVRALMGIVPPNSTVSGKVLLDGSDLRALPTREARSVWGSRIGMVFQNPMTALNPVVRIGRQISEAARKHLGLSAKEANARVVELLEQVGIPEPHKRRRYYPHQFSGGMRQRVTIAIALACEPELLIADEATTALDVTIQKQILNLLQRIQKERNMAMILVSHDLGVVAGRTDDVAVMYGGRIVEKAPTSALFTDGRHRYTEALLGAIPRIDAPSHARLRAISGSPPDMASPPPGCPFAPRCSAAINRCRELLPALSPAATPGHTYACYVPVTGEPSEAQQELDTAGAAAESRRELFS